MAVRWLCGLMLVFVSSLSIGCAIYGNEHQTVEAKVIAAPLFENLGRHKHPISTSAPLVQRYFDQGLILTFGFNHAEAIRSFREAARLDPHCAICYWGVALALGPNINAAMSEEAVPEAYEALQQAVQREHYATPQERAYIQVLSTRYGEAPTADRETLDLAYANAMRELVRQYPDDLDVATLFAEALMDLAPWNYWTEGCEPRQGTTEILNTLEAVLEQDPTHPGANHLYIHAVETCDPERALPAADRLADLVPGSGHLVHMPAHIYLRLGRYDQASRANERAALADEVYFAESQAQGLYPAMYYPHNIHFLWYSATLEGRDRVAIDAAHKLTTLVGEEQVRLEPGLELFRPTLLFALTQFGQWEKVLQQPQPASEFTFHLAMWHYTRGMAFATSGKLAEADAEQANLMRHSASPRIKLLESATGAFPAAELLDIAQHTLAGDLARHRGQQDDMIRHFQEAVKIQDSLPYMEPPYWYVPVRHFLGEALLRTGQAIEAEQVYREDLERNPRNGWALFGLRESVRAQGKDQEVGQVTHRFQEAWAYATVELNASRF